MKVGTDYTVEWTIQNFSCWCDEMHYKVLRSGIFFGKSHFEILRTKDYNKPEKISIRMLLEYCPEVLGDLSLIGPDEYVFCSEEVDFCSKNNRSFTFELKSTPPFNDIKDRLKKMEDFLKDKITVRFQKRGALNNVLSMQTVIPTQEFMHKIDPNKVNGYYSTESKSIDTIKFRSSKGILQSVDVYCQNTDRYSSDSTFRLKLTAQHESTSIRLHLFQKKKIGGAVVQSRVDELVLSPSMSETARKAYLKNYEVGDESTNILLCIRVIPEDKSELKCTYVPSNENTLQTATVSPPISNKTEKPNDITCSPSASNKCIEDTSKSSKACTSSPSASNKSAEDTSESSKVGTSNGNSLNVLSKDLMCLLQDQDLSDITLKCADVTFPAHRIILNARSPVFKTMLSTDMQEAASGQVDITDLNPSTLACFLTFLYTGSVGEEGLQEESALNLYYAADKYQVPSLKRECFDFLCGNVSVSNVCNILSLADKHKDDELLTVSQNFILDHYNDVLGSKEWATFMEKESLLAVKTVTKYAQKKHVVKKA